MRCCLALFSSYRNDQYADAEGFKTCLGAVLEGFPDEVIRYVCDPRTGLQRRMKWPPTISEVVEACEEHQEYLRKAKASRHARPALAKPYEPPKAVPVKVFVAKDHPGFSKIEMRCEPWTSPDGREGVLVPPEYLIDLGLMKRGAAHD